MRVRFAPSIQRRVNQVSTGRTVSGALSVMFPRTNIHASRLQHFRHRPLIASTVILALGSGTTISEQPLHLERANAFVIMLSAGWVGLIGVSCILLFPKFRRHLSFVQPELKPTHNQSQNGNNTGPYGSKPCETKYLGFSRSRYPIP